MKSIFFFILIFSFASINGVSGQSVHKDSLKKLLNAPPRAFNNMDSLKQLLVTMPTDTNRVKLLLTISDGYYFNRPDTCLIYSKQAMSLARELRFIPGLIRALRTSGEMLRLLGDYPGALKYQFEALALSKKHHYPFQEVLSLNFIGVTYIDFKEYRQGLNYLFDAPRHGEQTLIMRAFNSSNMGFAYDKLEMPDSALFYQKQAYQLSEKNAPAALISLILERMGDAFLKMGNTDSALIYFHRGLLNSLRSDDRVNVSTIQKRLAETYFSLNNNDSSFFYAHHAFATAKLTAQKPEIMEAAEMMKHLYRAAGNTDSAFFYADIVGAMKDSIYGAERFRQLQMLMLTEQERQQKMLQEQEQYRNRIRYGVLLGATAILLFIGVLLYRNNRLKQQARLRVEKAYTELKETQEQLVQREKMASLGELTAGIAHEIQNPLNFVNNFSEVNTELLLELNDELSKGNMHGARALADDIRENEKKINQHGKRADAIVKSMLQHSRANSGKRESTDINALADEYFRMAYHGLRAKDKSFNALMVTDYDPNLNRVSVVPQEIGRVILNLLTNAFHAVDGKKKQNQAGYEPTVWLTTRKQADTFEIRVKDNGAGIPAHVLHKIYQPFFTTKPTGQGTGLGLSMSYDIVTKGHGGDIKVETLEGEGTEFIIQLPSNNSTT